MDRSVARNTRLDSLAQVDALHNARILSAPTDDACRERWLEKIEFKRHIAHLSPAQIERAARAEMRRLLTEQREHVIAETV